MPNLAQVANYQMPQGWGYFLGGNGLFGAETTQNEYGQNFLRQLQQFDPNAHFEGAGQTGGEGGGDTYSRLVYDASKLPHGQPSRMDLNPGAYAAFRNDPNASIGGRVLNDAGITNDGVWGRTTAPSNFRGASDRTWVDVVGPLLVGGIAGLAGGGLGLTLSNGLVNSARSLGSGQGLNLGSLIGMAGGALGLPSWASSGASSLASLVGRNRGNTSAGGAAGPGGG